MDFAEVRRLTIVALFSDDLLFEQVVLKGGNALNLVYGLSPRTSLDLDFSLENDFADLDDTCNRIFFCAIRGRFSSAGFVVFDESFEAKPQVPRPNQQAWWGGYELKFKLIEHAKYKALGGSLETICRNALVVGPEQQRRFSVDMSKGEYCNGKVEELDSYTIYVYSPEMIVVEKLRAICQQMPEYTLRIHPSPRARDFYDIWRVVTELSLNLATPEIFDLAKQWEVPPTMCPIRYIYHIGPLDRKARSECM